ncbi:MAG TPA: DNA ligase D [Flavobacteriaceae bacterium]|nr:DNA ligase D [Flavobacteriaceae bacterium]
MPLEEYNKKRQFESTPEPVGKIEQEESFRFVIQRHQATRLHYDLRLEMEGVLKSWAVPKGPSMNPKDKRLAMQTEDHPVKYLTFHGVIPKGNYGAGMMDIWDSGTYKILESKYGTNGVKQLEKGDLKIEFFGEKIKGSFALVKTNRDQAENAWLLIKKKDKFATDLAYDAEVLAEKTVNPVKEAKKLKVLSLEPDDFIKPMLASPAKKIFKDPNWIFEYKWDGYRMLSNIKNGKATIYSRNGISYNQKFKKIKDELEHIPHDCILDGEVVVLDDDGKINFQKLQKYDSIKTKGRLVYYVFDLLHLNGNDTTGIPLTDRKSLLPKILKGLEDVLLSEHVEGMGPTLFKKAMDAGMEGVMAKKAESTYIPGYRTENWLKIKEVNTEEAIICGYTESPAGGIFGSLILGMYQNGELVHVGNVGTGFAHAEQKKLMTKFKKLETDKNPFDKKISLKGRIPHWMKPELVCEVKFLEWTKAGSMRHPSYKGLRIDKNPEDVVPQEEKDVDVGKIGNTQQAEGQPREPKETSESSNSAFIVNGISLSFSNLEKIYWPKEGLTKFDLINYYIQLSDYILPYLKDRPQNMHRHPNGIYGQSFYQKDNEVLPDWVETFPVFSESSKKEINYLLCQNEATLLYMANLGCIEINPWNSTIQDLEKPTFTVIDLDPSPKNTFEEVVQVALVAEEVLAMAGVTGYPKTSGSTGIHIFIPLNNEYSYDEARDFAKILCMYIQKRLPKLTTLERTINKRGGKIYLDFLQNRRGQTLAAPYCARPKDGATVSAPLTWDELKADIKIQDFHIKNMPQRLAEIGDLFQPVLTETLNMEASIQFLMENEK